MFTKSRAIIYARYSPRPQQAADNCESANIQIGKCTGYADMRNFALAAEPFIDKLTSGSTPLAKRPAGKKLVAALNKRTPIAHHVIITKLDRGFRNVSDCLDQITTWDQRGITLHIIDLGGATIDTASATGRLFLTLLAAMAAWERGIISERTSDAMRHSQANGRRMSDQTPYGWKRDPRNPALLTEIPREQAGIVAIVELHAAGYGLREIGRELMRRGRRCRGREWRHSTIKRILRRAGCP